MYRTGMSDGEQVLFGLGRVCRLPISMSSIRAVYLSVTTGYVVFKSHVERRAGEIMLQDVSETYFQQLGSMRLPKRYSLYLTSPSGRL